MGRETKKRRVDDVDDAVDVQGDPAEDLTPATDEEKRSWQGFSEIESDPAFFDVMLKDLGVKGVKVQEIFGLEEEMLNMLPKPIYGLIFLFHYNDRREQDQEAACPPNVWFANQTTGNACATVALLNIVNNIQGIELGDHLENFKNFTADFTPALRGVEIAHFEFVKHIHNSFARKLDMLNIDLAMKEDFDSSKNPRPSQTKSASNDESNALHFIAYVPIDGTVWQLDGLDRQPEVLDDIDGDDWMEVVIPAVTSRMAEYEGEQLEFGLLGLVQDPLIELKKELAVNIWKSIKLDTFLTSKYPEWPENGENEDGEALTVNRLDQIPQDNGLTKQSIEPEVPDATEAKFQLELESHENLSTLIDLRRKISSCRAELNTTIGEEETSARLDEEKAAERRRDYGPTIQTWLKMLAENNELKGLVEAANQNG